MIAKISNTKDSMRPILDKLFRNARAAAFRGYDPYDFAETTSKLPHGLLSKFSFLNKISPVNFRPLLGIQPSSNAKANGLWLAAMLKDNAGRHTDDISFLLEWIDKNRSTEFVEFSMGFTFRMALSRYASGPGKTSLIISLFLIYPMIEMYDQTRNHGLLEKILSFESLLENKWLKYETDSEIWYSYLPTQKDEVYNATAKIGRFYAMLYQVYKDQRFVQIIEKILHYLQRVQEADGHWGYSVKAPYVDNFHTAFVLESIFYMRKVVDTGSYHHMYEIGLDYYLRNCFSADFVPLHFSKLHGTHDIRSKILGTEIRDCANAIILFSKIGRKQEARKILDWTKTNFYREDKNYFSFYRNGVYVNKINFIRWQAWMALAIAEYLDGSK